MTCTYCGGSFADHVTGVAFELPDDVWMLPETERAERVKRRGGVCVLDNERFFVRGVLAVRVADSDHTLEWSVWTEIAQDDYLQYLMFFLLDGASTRPAGGTLANTLRGYDELDGHPVVVRFGAGNNPPNFELEKSTHCLYRDQREGISHARLHELIDVH